MSIAVTLCALVFFMLIQASNGNNRFVHGGIQYSAKEKALIDKLFVLSGYNPLVRPVENASEVIEIEFSLQLSQVIYIDEKNQIMKSNVWLGMYWYDYQRAWNPKDFGDIKEISVDAKNVWTPDIVLLNNVDGKYEVSYNSKVVLYSSGCTMYIPPAIYQSSCVIDVSYFPYDQQICDMKFGSWSFTRSEMKLIWKDNNSKAIMDDYYPSGTWDVLDSPAIIEEYYDSGIWKTHALYRFYIRRKTLFYVVNLIIPCVLISFVTPSVHLLPTDACEKITLSVSILITLVVFIFLVSKILPPFAVVPLLYKYLMFTVIMNVVAVLATVIVINRGNRTPRTHNMPNWVRVVFLKHLPRLLFMKRPSHDTRWRKPNNRNDLLENRRDDKMVRILPDYYAFKHSNCQLESPVVPNRREMMPDKENKNFSDNTYLNVPEDFVDAIKAVKFISKHMQDEEEFETVIEDWKYVAQVMDRVIFYVGFLSTLFGTLGMLVIAPSLGSHQLLHFNNTTIAFPKKKCF